MDADGDARSGARQPLRPDSGHVGLIERGGAPEIAWSYVFDLLAKTSGVRKIEPYDLKLNGLPSDVKLAPREFPTLGDVRLLDALTGVLL